MNRPPDRADTALMSTGYGKALLILAAIAFCVWSWRTIERRLPLRPNRQAWMGALLAPAAILILALAANALAFLGQAMLAQEMAWMEGDGIGGSAGPPTWWDSLSTQLSVLGGTCALMWLVRVALTRPEIYEGRHPKVAGVLAQKRMIEQLVIRHWLAVLGLGVVFGVASGPGIVLLLAIELSIMWLGAHLGLTYFRGRLIDADSAAAAEGSDESDADHRHDRAA